MDFLAAIRRDSDRFYAAAEGADAGTAVESCPGWTVADLVWHLGEVHWFWGTDVEMRATDPDGIERAKPPRPGEYRELVAWARAQADRLIQLLDGAADGERVWTWALDESQHNVGFIRRHQVQEAAVHRWDMERAVRGEARPIEADVASDSIDEFLTITLPWCVRADKPLPGSVHLHCTDVAGEWYIHPDGRVEPEHRKGDVAMRGAASDLLLTLYKRVAVDGLDIVGDAALAHRLVDAVNTE